MLDLIITIISGIFIGIAKILGFIFTHIIEGFGSLIQQLTIKVGMLVFGLAFIGYVATHI